MHFGVLQAYPLYERTSGYIFEFFRHPLRVLFLKDGFPKKKNVKKARDELVANEPLNPHIKVHHKEWPYMTYNVKYSEPCLLYTFNIPSNFDEYPFDMFFYPTAASFFLLRYDTATIAVVPAGTIQHSSALYD
jgi:hypothetical protein